MAKQQPKAQPARDAGSEAPAATTFGSEMAAVVGLLSQRRRVEAGVVDGAVMPGSLVAHDAEIAAACDRALALLVAAVASAVAMR